jgi:hypothetical protein
MRKDDIQALLNHIDNDLVKIKARYQDSLTNKEIPSELRIDVKNAMENLRSCLDYMVQDVYEIVVSPDLISKQMKELKKVYFPYGKTKQDFDSSIQKNLPNLMSLNGRLFDIVESIQTHKTGSTWLYDFCSILNSNKHDALSPQERTERKSYSVGLEGRGPSISGPAGAIKAPPGAISIGGRPLVFDKASGIPLQTPGLEVRVTIWVDFKFQDTDVSVLILLQTVRNGIGNLQEQLYKELEK